jgi:hypothetical protein
MIKNPLDEINIFPPFDGYPKEGITFLKQLKKNNNREWFAKHKQEYEDFVKLPMQSLVAELNPMMKSFASDLTRNGLCLESTAILDSVKIKHRTKLMLR